MDFDTTRDNGKRESDRRSRSIPEPSAGRKSRTGWGGYFDTARTDRLSSETGNGAFRIPAGSRKAALVHLALEAWHAGLLDPKALSEVRGREVDEAGLQRALYRSSMGEIEHVLGPIIKGRRVVVEGHLAGTGRTAIERLGAEVEELRLEDQKRYLDMTPVVFTLVLALLFYPVSRVGFDGLIYRLGGDDELYGRVTKVTNGDTITVKTQGRITPVRLIGVDTPETVAPNQPIGCFGKEATNYTKGVLADRLVKLEIPRIGDSKDAYGRTLAYIWVETKGDGSYDEHLFNEDLITLGLARTTTFSHAYRREFERLEEEAEARGAGLWGACSEAT